MQLEQYFDSIDSRFYNTGRLTIEMFDTWSENMRKLGKAPEEVIQNVYESSRNFWKGGGILPGKPVTKKEFIEGMNRLANDELEKERLGKPTLHGKCSNDLYDGMGLKSDDFITVEHVKVFMKCVNMDPEGAVAYFAMADKEKKGKISREDLIKLEFGYWFQPEDSNKKMFGGAYEAE
jgi:hypothetical protein